MEVLHSMEDNCKPGSVPEHISARYLQKHLRDRIHQEQHCREADCRSGLNDKCLPLPELVGILLQREVGKVNWCIKENRFEKPPSFTQQNNFFRDTPRKLLMSFRTAIIQPK